MTANLTLTYGALNLTASPYLVPFGTDTGAPENEVIPLASFIQDGDIELSSRAGNRTVTFDVLIEGASLTALATAEAALVAETEKVLNTLTVDPGDSAPAAVYDVFRGQVSLVRDDTWELARMRRYTITVRALPFPRSATEVTAAALSGGSTTNNVDTMGATTGWTATSNGVSATVVNAVGPPTINSVSQTAILGDCTIVMTKTISTTTSALKYLIVDWRGAIGNNPNQTSFPLNAIGDGVTLPRIASWASPTAGYLRTYFFVAAASITSLSLSWKSTIGTPPTLAGTRLLSLDNVAISDVRPGIGSARQQLRTIQVAGSARTPGSLAVESTTAALGDTLIYAYPSNTTTKAVMPPLRQFRTAGNATSADGSSFSGFTENISGSGVTYQIPIEALPAGSYLLMARLSQSGSPTTVTTTARAVLGGNNLTPVTTSAISINLVSFQLYALARLVLPSVDLGVPSAAVQSLNIAASATCTLDEAWLFNTTIGQVIQVACGAGAGAVGGSARRVFIEPATVATPRPTILVGHSADRSDAYRPTALSAWQQPQFTPPEVNVFTATLGATDAGVSLRYYPRWHTSPAS